MLNTIKPVAKAIVGGLTSGLTSYGVAIADGTVTQAEWVVVALSFLAGLGIVYAVPNSPNPVGQHEAP